MGRGVFLTLAVLGGAWPAGARAAPGWTGVVSTEEGSGVNIQVRSAFAKAPESGFMPLEIQISNHSGGARTWTFQASSNGALSTSGSRMKAFREVRVENDTESRAEMLLPVLPVPTGTNGYRSIMVEVDGYGVALPRRVSLPFDYRSSSNPPTVFVGMSEKLSTRSWGILEKYLTDRGEALKGSQTDLKLLPPDWRALAGVGCLWLTPGDYAGLDAGRQTAIKDWVGQGGVLYVCEPTPDQSTRAEFGLRDPAGTAVPLGFGEVRWFHAEDDKELPGERVASEIVGLRNWQRDPQEAAETWPMAKGIGTLKLNTSFLLSFIALFALLVGPVNLFYFARANRRHRLFWTTPVISLGASLLLIGFIVLQDGFGGNGSRVVLTYLLPAQNKAVTVQEQGSRTGVLFSRGFDAPDDAYLAPVTYRNTNDRQFQQTGKAYGGDWFASRSLQAQRIETVQQTRSRVGLLNAEQAKAGAPPVIVSSLPVELDELLYLDEAGRYWHGKSVRTGQQQTLQPDSGSSRVSLLGTGGSSYLDSLLRRAEKRPGHFYAQASTGTFTDTLPSIRWSRDRAVFAGPVTTDR